MTQTDRNMQVKFCLKVTVYSWGLEIWVSSTSFQKINIGWPQQPPTERVPHISENLDFWWFIPQKKDRYWSFWCHWWSNHQDQRLWRAAYVTFLITCHVVCEHPYPGIPILWSSPPCYGVLSPWRPEERKTTCEIVHALLSNISHSELLTLQIAPIHITYLSNYLFF